MRTFSIRALILTLLGAAVFGPTEPARAQSPRPPVITSISVCSTTGSGGQGSCPNGSFDTHQVVLGPGGATVNQSSVSVAGAADEHSTVFAPGTLGSNQDYLFFLASGIEGNPGIGVSVLSGGSGPNQSGQWTLNLPQTDGYGSYAAGFGQVFNPSSKADNCPKVPDGNPAHQDQTFDMHYAAPGSIVKDPTAAPGSLLMIYEGTNACIGNAGGPVISNTDDYISLAIATSLDYGKTWPTYRGTSTFTFIPLPGVNPTQGPNAPMGALGKNVCMGNDCSTTPPAAYGRYVVVTPPTSLASLMAAGQPLTSKFGEQEISGFVDDAAGGGAPYLYANSGDVRVSRAQLNGGTAPLTFQKWNGQAFASPGLGGTEASVLPGGLFENCEAPPQSQFGSSISYVEDTQQYLLTFLCVSPSDPALGAHGGGNLGGAWFYSTSYNLSDQTQWTVPREIPGSWSTYDQSGGCADYKGFYPSFMSLGKSAGHLSLTGYVFYLWGCQTAGTPAPGRQFSYRAFTITTSPGPQIFTGGVVIHAGVSPVVSPGSLVDIYGTNLAAAAVTATAGANLPTTLGGVRVLVNGMAAPLIYVGAGQVIFQMPYEAAIGTAQVVVISNNVLSPAAAVTVQAAAPFILTYGSNRAVVANQDGSVNSSTKGAKPGDELVAYLIGSGPLDNPIPTGALAPSSPLSQEKQATSVTVAGSAATVKFAGMTPGFAGLVQVNFIAPNLTSGDYPLEVMIGGITTNQPLITISQ
ncbi:MAG TPA: hypothetical protein VKB88_38845 [Bryobacteraceae bacterium]|nr:hypothetical protein [Bryobacteraceae bacterium]